MPYLLNLIYLLLILLSLPWLVWQAVRKGKYREGYAAKFLGTRAAENVRQETASGCTPSAWAKSICWRRC